MWYTKVLLIKKEKGCNVVLYSSKHEEIIFPREFILYLLRSSLGHIAKKNVVSSGGGVQQKYVKGKMAKWGKLSMEGGLETFHTL